MRSAVLDCEHCQFANSIGSTGKGLQTVLTCLNMSFCVSDGRSRMVIVFVFSEPCAGVGPGVGEDMLEAAMAVVWFLFELNGSNSMAMNVRSQTSSVSEFTRGVVRFRRDDLLPGRAGMAEPGRRTRNACLVDSRRFWPSRAAGMV